MTPAQPGLPRRAVLAAAAVGSVSAVAVGAAGCGSRPPERQRFETPALLSQTVAITGPTSRQLVDRHQLSELVEGSRVLRGVPGQAELVRGETAFLTAAEPHGAVAQGNRPLYRSALQDLHSLLLPGGVALGGWSPAWRYVWPRDAAHVAAALAATGHPQQAFEVLEFLQRVQQPGVWFQARYAPDGSGSPDDRPRQLDGAGWTLWACSRLTASVSPVAARRYLDGLRRLVVKSTELILDVLDPATGLPPPSPDYWEVPETDVTLGTVAPLLAGLEAAPAMLRAIREHPLAERAGAGADRLRRAMVDGFGPGGYPRHLHGTDRDAAVAFLFPPYLAVPPPGAPAALAVAAAALARPAGGLSPGSSWADDGISWTPETALVGLAEAAAGDTGAARQRLRWLAAHRTAAGSLPEKVLFDGAPAAVAPLAWTAALVVLLLTGHSDPD